MVLRFIADCFALVAGGWTERQRIRTEILIGKLNKLVGRESFIWEYENRGNR